MEIVHIILGKANPARMNGVNKVVYQLATQQAIHNKKVSVWGITHTPQDHNFGDRNFETRLFPASRNPFNIHRTLRKTLHANRSRIMVHLHGGWLPRYAMLARLLVRLKIPYVITPHGAYNTQAMKRSAWMKKVYFQLAERYVLKNAARIHCIGASEVDGLSTIFKAQNVALVPYGFTPNDAPPASPSLDTQRMVVGFVGRLDIHTKGLDLLLDAVAGMNCNNLEVWIIGDGPERSRLEAMIRERKLEQTVICHGSKFGAEKEECLARMNVFVHPSRNEGLPSAVLEAASLGVPCIISEATNLGRFVRDYYAGLVIANDDADALRTALTKCLGLYDRQLLTVLGKNARHMVAKAFAWETVVKEFDRLYTHESQQVDV